MWGLILLVILILLFAFIFFGTNICRWLLHQDLPDSLRMGAYYTGYVPMMVLPSSEEEIKTKYGFSIYGSAQDSTLMKCFHLANDYEPSLVKVINYYLPKGGVLVDVGANEGYFTLLAASKGAYVYAIEPSRANLKLLMKNVEKNGFQDLVVPLPYAAGDENKPIAFNESMLNGMWSSVGSGKTNFLSRETQVEMRRIADIIDVIPNVVKIDVEGFEADVVAGALPWVTRKETVWIIEMDDTITTSIIQLFRCAGYHIYTLVVDSACLPGRMYEPEEYTSKVGFRNFIFVPDHESIVNGCDKEVASEICEFASVDEIDICTSRDATFQVQSHTISN